jgi:hypothetical protein
MRTALAQRDIGRVYTLLTAAGISQHSIAWLTGQSQSEVSEMARRQLARAAEGWVPEGRADQATMDEARGGGDRAPSTPGPAQTPGSWPVWPAASPPPGHSRNPPGRVRTDDVVEQHGGSGRGTAGASASHKRFERWSISCAVPRPG